ncbi:MAG: hypothetical protein K2X93_04255 [Candidatus Obscuribacterales bacterium]|nr:hypothetical protein [Candidatus Obscuribacterales bacterium]
MLDLGSNRSQRDRHAPPEGSEFENGQRQHQSETDVSWTCNLPKDSIWGNWQGVFVMLLGVVLPGILIVSGTVACFDRIVLLLWKQPIETLVEMTLLGLIPIANCLTWNALCKNDCRYAIRRGALNGIGIGSSLIIGLITGIAAMLRFPTVSQSGVAHVTEFGLISALSLLSTGVAVYLALRVRQARVVRSSQKKALQYVAFGVVIALFAFVAAEARSTCIRIAACMATSDTPDERIKGLKFLKALNAEKELRMECSSRKACGLPGLFLRVDNDTLRQLHFASTGKTFGEEQSQNFATMTDEYLKSHVVGEPVKDLSLQKSGIYGQVNPTTVSSTLYWTFVFSNKNYEPQEARAEIGLPEGAVISGMTIWRDGHPLKTEFKPTGDTKNASWSNIGHDAPAIITDLGRGRMLLHCYPVPAQGYLRMAVAVTVPLRLHTISDATLALPRFIETNFEVKGDHDLRLLSDSALSLNYEGISTETAANGQKLVTGRIKSETLSGSGLAVSVKRQPVYGPIAIKDAAIPGAGYLLQTIREIPSTPPQHLVVVLDGSESMKPHVAGIKKALSKLPADLKTSLVVASPTTGKAPNIYELGEGLENLKLAAFDGGQDNLEAIVAASSVAGESKRGAVLWIHGPQPGFNREIYLMSPYVYTPSFFELALDDGIMDSSDYFKNHREIGPFTEISRSAAPESDLERFFSRWKPNGHDYVVEYQLSKTQPKERVASIQQSKEISLLFARERVMQLLRANCLGEATDIALNHQIVTPVSLSSCTGVTETLNSERLAYEHGTGNVRIVDTSYGGSTAAKGDTTNNTAVTSQTVGTANKVDRARIKPVERQSNSDTTTEYTELTNYNQVAQAEASITQGAAPVLQGAVNGTIGPQSVSTMGVNTAGTVRVNNLASLEATLNMFANACEIGGLALGVAFLLSAPFEPVLNGSSLLAWGRMGKVARIASGLLLLTLGLMTPHMVNYMLASARDANVFS